MGQKTEAKSAQKNGGSKYKGVLYILCAAFCFALMNMFVRMAGDNIPSIEKSFFRNLVALFFSAAILFKNRISVTAGKGNLTLLLIRASFGTLGIFCNFYAVDHLPISDASMLNKLSPFFAIIFSYFILKEKIKPYQAGCLILAFIGALLIVRPGGNDIQMIPALIGALGGLGAGVAYTMVRLLGKRNVPGAYIVFFFSTFSCLAALPSFFVNFAPLQHSQLLFLLLAGLAATGGQFSITAAYTHAPAKEISIYDYSQILFAAILGYLFLDQIPDGMSVIGYIVIFTASLIMFLENNRNEA